MKSLRESREIVAKALDRVGPRFVARREFQSARAMGAEICPASKDFDYMHARLTFWQEGAKCPGCGAAL